MPTLDWIGEKVIAFEKGNRMRNTILLCMALIVTISAVYMQAGNYPFLASFDKIDGITNNPHIESGLTVKNIIWAFTSVEAFNWHPITWLSHMTIAQFCGMNPSSHHLANVFIHTASSVLLFLLLLRLTGALWRSLFVAALFGLHPLHVESVAWVAERKDVLSAFFWFLTLLFYSEYVAKKQKTEMYVLSLTTFILGLMSKPMLVTLPVVMLLMDFWPLERYKHEVQEHGLRQISERVMTLVKEKTPFFACSFLSAVVTIYAQNKGEAIKSFYVMSFGHRIENALIAYVKYICKTLWPQDLAVLYPIPLSIPLWQVIGSLLVLILLSAGTIWAGRRHPCLVVGWFWFLVTLVPVIGLIQVGGQSMADRYSYIPVIGLFIIAAWGVPVLAKGLQHREGILALLGGAVIIASAALTWQQLGYWRDSISLFRHTLQITDGNYSIINNLGLALAEKGDMDGAIQQYQEALKISPNNSEAHNNLGVALAQKGNLDAAIQKYREALRLNPNYTDAHYNLGIALAETGNLDAGIQELQEALRISPNDSDLHNSLGLALASKGQLDAAIREFREALRIYPNYTEAHNNLGIVLAQKRGLFRPL